MSLSSAISPALWPSAGPLPSCPRLFLEASAGTGKTFAIEGIVVQLVAEAGLPIDKILVITFTKAATAELNDRVRQRLARVLAVLQGAQEAGGDVLAERLATAADRHVLAGRLAQALADIDRAPISTIHSFCQRMLQELAFESGQEAELEVLGEAREVREQLVADALAKVFAAATAEDLALLADMGWTPEGLRAVAVAMTGATAPALQPLPEPRWADPLAVVAQWRAELAKFALWFEGDAGREAVAGWLAELQRPSKSAAKGKVPHNRLSRGPKTVDAAIRAWLASDGQRSERPYESATHWLDAGVLRSKWDETAGPVEDFAGFALAERVTRLCQVQDALWPQPLVQFAARVRVDYQAEIDRRAQLTYDGMLSRLAERLVHDEQRGATTLADAIRSRYRAALVDEFQDTDSSQWQVIHSVFGRSDTRFFVVGDPKQSIYRFRGADLDVYLAARAGAECYQLGTNYRSDAPLVGALNMLWTQANLPLSMNEGGEQVRYLAVAAAKELRIAGLPAVANVPERPRRPLELRLCTAETDGGEPESKPSHGALVEVLAQVCARECQTLLEAQPMLQTAGGERALQPGDVAVLVASHREAAAVGKQLTLLGIPAVAAGRGSLFHSDALDWLVLWLDALATAAHERPARLLAVSPLIGWTADMLTRAVAEPVEGAPLAEDQLAWHSLRQHLATLANSWPTQGFARVLDKTLAKYDVLARLLGSLWGERSATDLRHLTELCQAEDRRTRAGPRGLAEWLRARRAGADDKNDEQATRLESDAAAVQLVTVHASKGLEYPVVLLPFAWAPRTESDAGQPLLVRGEQGPVLNMAAKGTPARAEAIAWADAATEAESVRLLYVAMTRARHHVVAWLNRLDVDGAGALARLALQGNPQQLQDLANQQSAKKEATVADKLAAWQAGLQERLNELQQSSAGLLGWSAEPPPTPPRKWQPQDTGAVVGPTALPFDASLALGAKWQVASFSSLSAGRGADDDEPSRALAELATTAAVTPASENVEEPADVATVEAAALGDLASQPWLLEPAAGANLPGGTATGDWIHGVFEELDFAPGAELRAKDGRPVGDLMAELAQRFGVAGSKGAPEPCQELAGLLPKWLDTPLDGAVLDLPRGFSLRSLSLEHRLDELGFDMRLGAGADYRSVAVAEGAAAPGCVDMGGVRQAMQIGAQTAGFGGATWCQAMLDQAGDQPRVLVPEIAGFLTGFIDLTFRVGGRGADARYYLADYKSNAVRGPDWLASRLAALGKAADRDAPRLANAHYTRPLLQWAMAHAGYHLQALVYTVALHRLLQARLGAAYSYDRHIGGHLYLFLKGMAGPATPRWHGSCLGVWADRWPEQAVLALDRALLGKPAVAPAAEAA